MERRLGSTALGGRLRTVATEEICFDLGSGSIGPGGGGGVECLKMHWAEVRLCFLLVRCCYSRLFGESYVQILLQASC